MHRTLKPAIIAQEDEHWTETLQLILLKLRSSYKPDIVATSAELVYGTTLCLTGKLLIDKNIDLSPNEFVKRFTVGMRSIHYITDISKSSSYKFQAVCVIRISQLNTFFH